MKGYKNMKHFSWKIKKLVEDNISHLQRYIMFWYELQQLKSLILRQRINLTFPKKIKALPLFDCMFLAKTLTSLREPTKKKKNMKPTSENPLETSWNKMELD